MRMREVAWKSGWCWFTCAPAVVQMRACRVSTSVASQQGHLSATCSSIPMKRLPMPTNSVAGMTHSESVDRARRHMRWPLPLESSCRESSPMFWSPSPPAGRPVPVGVLSAAAGPAKQCAQHVGPGRPTYPTYVGRSVNLSLPRHARLVCRPLQGLGPRPPLRLDTVTAKIRGPFLPSLPSLPPCVSNFSQASPKLSDDTRFRELPPHSIS